ncbi:hypothetical protein DMENIID0001_017680 [Sergentomyia squamirostris]
MSQQRRQQNAASRLYATTEKVLGICTNGTLSSRSDYSNGSAKHDDQSDEHTSNGTAKTASKAADYYVRGEVPADITQRKIIQK